MICNASNKSSDWGNCAVRVQGSDTLIEAKLVGIFQYSSVLEPSPMYGGHQGGVVAYPVAVVRIGDDLKTVKVSDVVMRTAFDDF